MAEQPEVFLERMTWPEIEAAISKAAACERYASRLDYSLPHAQFLATFLDADVRTVHRFGRWQIETAIAVPVQVRTATGEICMYELTGKHKGVFATLKFQPATRAEDVFADIRKKVKVKGGAAAQPDRLSVGEGGWGYTSGGRNEPVRPSMKYTGSTATAMATVA